MIKVYHPMPKFTALERIWRGLYTFAPDEVVYVNRAENADIQIVDFIGQNWNYANIISTHELELLPRIKRYILLVHTTGHYGVDYTLLIKNALAVVSYIPPRYCVFRGRINWDVYEEKLILTPWGVNPNAFYPVEGINRDIDLLFTGGDCRQELVDKIDSVCSGINCLHFGPKPNCEIKSQTVGMVPDEELNLLYNRAKFVVSVRLYCGFEMPLVEGAFANAMPIAPSLPVYRYWYEGIAEFFDVDNPSTIREIVTKGYRKPDRETYLAKFSDKVVYPRIWREIIERIK